MSDLKKIVEDSFSRYAGAVIANRAICDARDMLKPSTRMLLYSQKETTKNTSDKPFVKSARVVGDALGHWYTHGDSSCYGTYMRMGKTFAMRYPLEECQGNAGTIIMPGDEAASRYCVTGDTLVLSDKGFEYIGSITHSQEDTDNDIDYPKIKGFFDDSGSSCLLNSGLQDIIEIRTKYGYNIKVTPNHPLLTIDEEFNPKWVLAEDLKVNDKVLIDLNPNFTWGGYENLTEAAMLGIWIAEGSITTKNRIDFVNQDLEYLKPAENWLKSHGWKGNIRARKTDKCYSLTSGRKDIYDYFINLDCGMDSYSKHIPNKILKSSKNNIGTFLSYLFEGDGAISCNKIAYSSVSKRLINELQNILAMGYGINSTITYSKTRNEIKLEISGKINLIRFQQYINFVSTRKKEKLQQSTKELSISGGNNPRNFSMIKDFIKKYYYGKGLLKTGNNKCYISNYDGLSRLKSVFSQEDYLKIEKFYLYHMLVPIEEIKIGRQEVVYSFRINSDTHDYVGNSFINHNTELRLSKLGDYLFRNIKKDCIEEWENNFDDTEQYPRVLPSLGFYNIVNGSTGIGVSLSSSICQYNLRETNEAMIKLLWNEDEPDENILCMPDFATGATILNEEEIKQSLLNGTGPAVKMRATIEYDSDHNELIVTELPYSVYTSTITAQIQKLLEKEPNCGIIGINDGSGKTPNYIISLKKGTSVSRILKLLYKNTSLQYHYSINMTVLEDGRIPKVYGWRKLLLSHIHHEEEVYTRAFQYDLKKIKARLHIIEGLLKAYDVIDEVIQLIKKSKNTPEANNALCDFLQIDKVQADAILSMKLSALSKLDITKLMDEQSSLNAEADRITAILTDDSLLKKEIEHGLREVMEKFGDDRRTKITNVELDEEEEPVDLTKYTISVTSKGKITSTKSSTLYAHKRGTVGKKNKLSNGEYIIGSFSGVNGDNGVFLSKKGVAYSVKFEDLISQDKTYLSAICDFEEDDELKACINIPKNSSKKEHIIFVTKHGYIKKSELSEYRFTIQKGVRALTLEDGDEVVSILLTNSDNIGILTHKGMFVITQTTDIRAIGRAARGVVGIKLGTDDYVVSSRIVCDKTNQLLFVMENGNGYKVDKDIFSAVGRGAKGRNVSNKKDFAIDFLTINENIDIMIISNEATIVINTKDIASVRTIGATGVKLINLEEKSKIKKVEKVTL